MRRIAGMSIALLGLVVGVSSVNAQQIRGKVDDERNLRADQLRRSAELLYEKPSQLRRAAQLHEQEASVRTEGDPMRVDALAMAGRLHAYSGNAQRGHEVMARAAREALRCGDVSRAAHAFIDAAFIALTAGESALAEQLTQEADLLTLSPLLSSEDKTAIVRRIDPSRTQFGQNAR